MENFENNIGKRVQKCTIGHRSPYNPNPFKSGQKINTVKAVIDHPILHIPAYTFVEDDSYVECRRCCVVYGYTEHQNEILNLIEEHPNTIVITAIQGIGKTNIPLVDKPKKLTQHQIDALVNLNEGTFFNASDTRTLNILASRGLIKSVSYANGDFWEITDKGVDELNAVRPL